MCLAGAVVACWPLTQEVAEGQVRVLLLNDIFLSLNSVKSVIKNYKHLGKALLRRSKIGARPIPKRQPKHQNFKALAAAQCVQALKQATDPIMTIKNNAVCLLRRQITTNINTLDVIIAQ